MILSTKRIISFAISFSAVALIGFIAPNTVAAQDLSLEVLAAAEVSNLGKVSETIYRGGAPSDHTLEKLAQSGIHTLVDLRMDGDGTVHEEEKAHALGMQYVHIPMGFSQPSFDKITKFLTVALSPDSGGVYVHCRQGADRTGTLCAIYQRLVNGWSMEQAYAEMRLHHFKPFLISMKKTVEDFPYEVYRKQMAEKQAALKSQLVVRADVPTKAGSL
jgi:protein tyrosine/serine phosphatase